MRCWGFGGNGQLGYASTTSIGDDETPAGVGRSTRASTLCNGNCRFAVTQPRASLTLTVTSLRRRATYHYAVAARDNVSGRIGPRSRSVSVRTG